jgi:hypothetical protein
VRVYAGDATHRLPTEVTDSHCYKGSQMTAGTWAYLELLEDRRLAVAHGRGDVRPSCRPITRFSSARVPCGNYLCPAGRAAA